MGCQIEFIMNKNTELEQTILRITVLCLILLYFLSLAYYEVLPDGIIDLIILGTFVYLFISFFMFFIVILDFGYVPIRRITCIVLDITMTTIDMCYLSKYGAPMFVAYLWVTVGNGFRFGVIYLAICTFLSITGFSLVSKFNPYWAGLPAMKWMGLLLLALVPTYFAILLRRLQIEKTKAESASNEKSRFLANISHEMRTPLNAIVGFGGLVDNVDDESEKNRIIKRIQDASASLLSLVEDVLDFSRIESGHVELIDEDVNLYSLVVAIQEMFESLVQQKHIRFISDVSLNVPPLIRGDTQRLRQIFVNLVGNAVKFTQAGDVILRLTNIDMNSHATLQVEVIDTGEGIPADVQPYIFERFRQADNSVRRRHGGAGLGTSIAKHLVELMGGEIGFESEFSRGTRFWFRIPITSPSQRQDMLLNFPVNTNIVFVTNDTNSCEHITGTLGELSIPNTTITSLTADEVENQNIETTAPYCVIADCASLTDSMTMQIPTILWQKNSCYIALGNGTYERDRLLGVGYEQVADSPSELKNSLLFAAYKLGNCKVTESHNDLHPSTDSNHVKRVLIAEDSEMNRQVFRGILEYMGLDVNFANTGIEALKRLKEEIYDLAIIDIQMPEMSGFEVISRYKSLYGGNSRIPIVVVTGDVTKEVQDECEELGVDRFISKPVESEKLRGIIAEMLTTKQQLRL